MKSKFNIFSLIGQFISYIILVVLVILCLFFAFYIADNTLAKINNRKPLLGIYVIVSPSMVPAINVYDVIINTRVNSDSELNLGDIITFNPNFINTGGITITHRINTILNEDNTIKYITKGDHNASVDVGYTTLKDIMGKVKLIIPKIGNIQKVLQSKWGWFVVVLIPALGILLSDFIKLIDLFRIKKELIDIPDLSATMHEKEIKDNKKLRILMEKAEKLSENKGDKNEEGESTR